MLLTHCCNETMTKILPPKVPKQKCIKLDKEILQLMLGTRHQTVIVV